MILTEKKEPLDLSNLIKSRIDLDSNLEEKDEEDEEVSPMGESFSGTIEDEFRDGFKTSEKENEEIRKEADKAEGEISKSNTQQLIYPDNLENLIRNSNQQEKSNKKVYQDKPFIKNQAKISRHSIRVKERLINVFDLSKEEDLKKLNELSNQSIKEDTSIENLVLREHFSEKDGTWKILATYDILEFTNPF